MEIAFNTTAQTPSFFAGGGKMGELTRSHDWSKTPLGDVDNWPQSLKSAFSICLNSNFPIAIYWGKQLTLLYNDAWSPIPGNKHPWSLGKSAKEVWPEIWDALEPQFQMAFGGVPGGSKNALLPMERHGYTEECYFDFTFTPIYGEGGNVEGVFNAVIETTNTILNERQLETLRALSNLESQSKSVNDILFAASRALEKNNKDFPFGIIYRIDQENKIAFPLSYSGVDAQQKVFPDEIDLQKITPNTANFLNAYVTKKITVSENNNRRKNLPTGGWDKQATHFIHIPIVSQQSNFPIAIFSAALNPFRKFDATYQQFAQLISDQISTEVNNVLVLEEQKRRAEALAEIDKAKTAFFTNISHEFRTPLTLMLGTLEELLDRKASITNTENELIEMTYRNSLRLLQLVNNLLDFSRIESGRARARFQLVDIAEYTAGLAANFRSVIENAGLFFHINTSRIIQPVYVDREMWEKIVLNLLSNAFKYTLEGGITIDLDTRNNNLELKIIDTGVGIPAAELPKMFERFHRVQNVLGRTYEGSGIGLSLVNELVKLHGGKIDVSSQENKGSVFTVCIPLGRDHLPVEQIVSDSYDASKSLSEAFIEEANALLSSPVVNEAKNEHAKIKVNTILIVDDNADMRNHITKLLESDYNVLTAVNGRDALTKIEEHHPSLIVSDVMMPVMDGFQLVKSLKENPTTQIIPIILLSARAGEDAKIEGYETGADDYLVKPFSAKELLARIRSQLNLKAAMIQASEQIKNVFEQAPVAVCLFKGENYIAEIVNENMLRLWGMARREVINRPIFDSLPEVRKEGYEELLHFVYTTGERYIGTEQKVTLFRDGKPEPIFVNFTFEPYRESDGTISGVMVIAVEVTEQVLNRKKLEENNKQLQYAAALAENIVDAVISTSTIAEGYHITSWNKGAENVYGWKAEEVIGRPAREILSTQFLSESEIQSWQKQLDENGYWNGVVKQKTKSGSLIWINATISYVKDENGNVLGAVAVNRDISRQKEIDEKIKIIQKQLQLTIENVPAAVYLHDSNGAILYLNKTGQSTIEKIIGQEFKIGDDLDALIKKSVGKVEYEMENGEPLTDKDYPFNVVKQTGKEHELLIRREFKETGEVNWFLNRVTPLLDDENNIQFILSTSTDYTTIKQAAERIKESEERYATTVMASDLGLWDYDAQKRILIASGDMAEIYGLSSNEEYNINQVFESIHPDDLSEQQDFYNKITAGKIPDAFEMEYRIIQKNSGELRWIRSKGRAFFEENGSLYRTVGTVADITERKSAEEKLKESERRFRTLAETLPQLVWITDASGRQEFASVRWKEYSGIEPEDEKSWNEIVHPYDQGIIGREWKKSLESGVFYKAEVRLKNKAGEYRWHFVQGEPIKNEEGKIIKWIGAFTDIHDQKTLREKLENLVSERTKELQRSNEDLQQFAHVASHDLKEPVRKVMTFGNRLKEEFGSQLSQKANTYLSKIESSAIRMYSMIDGVLLYSSLDAMEQTKELIDLNELIQNIVTDLEVVIEEKNATIKFGNLPEIEGTPILIYQLFYNLVNNALKFTSPGVEPIIELTETSVNRNDNSIPGMHKGVEFIQLTLKDNGIGFTNDMADKIFGTFTRLHAKDRYEGTGLGLALCRKIVERHKGKIYAEGIEGKGAAFHVFLPKAMI
jgi:PAS domain S-box-containing protein